MVGLIVILSFCTIFLIIYSTIIIYFSPGRQIEVRLRDIEKASETRSEVDAELSRPVKERLIMPFINSIGDIVAKFTPQYLKKMVENLLAGAGGFGNLTVNEFLAMWGLFIVCFSVLSFVVVNLVQLPAQKISAIMVAAVGLGVIFPIMALKRKGAQRQDSIQKDLPEVLDLLTVSVEAGLAFDGALAKLTEKMKGALVDELARTLQEIRMGVTKRTALQYFAARCNVADVALFTTSLIQADQLGVSVSKVLRVQSVGMREKRRQRIQEKAMKAPVKMLLPLILFVFPTIFIVLLGPAFLRIMSTLAK